MPARVLSMNFGQFYGSSERKLRVRGFEIANLRATGRREDIALHTHPEAHIVFVTRGVYISEACRGRPLPAPVAVFNPPGVVHRDCFEGPGGAFVAVSISPAACAEVSDHLSLATDPVADSSVVVTGVAGAIFRNCVAPGPRADLAPESLCLELLGEFAVHSQPALERPPGWVRGARELLRERCGEELTIAEVSRELGVHRVHLARCFRRFFGCTPGEYLRRCRIEKAGTLLRENRLPLAEIALACGFADQSHLCKAFRGQCRITPGDFRRLV